MKNENMQMSTEIRRKEKRNILSFLKSIAQVFSVYNQNDRTASGRKEVI